MTSSKKHLLHKSITVFLLCALLCTSLYAFSPRALAALTTGAEVSTGGTGSIGGSSFSGSTGIGNTNLLNNQPPVTTEGKTEVFDPTSGGVKTDIKATPYGGTSASGGSSSGGGGGGGQPVRVMGGPGTRADIQTQTNTKKSAAMNTISAKKLGSLERKEYVLDGILHSIVKKLTQQLVKSALKWVASGFQGSPMFVTNPQQFFMSAADQVAGEVIYGSGLGSLCSPMNVRSALNNYYTSRTGRSGGMYGSQCTLSGALGNVTSGLGGTGGLFGSQGGGWGNWTRSLFQPSNTGVGSALVAQYQLDSQISQQQGIEQMKWDWGKGFLPKENCQTVNGERVCNTTTPGENIAQAVNFDLSVGKRELISADELNEVISALMSQLANQALQMAGGLFGLGSASQSSGYSNPTSQTQTQAQKDRCKALSYLDQIGSSECDGMTDGTANTNAQNAATGNTQSIVSLSVASELDYQAMNQNVSEAAGAAIANAEVCSENSDEIADLTEIKAAADGTITESNLTVQTLLAIQSQYDLGTEESQSQALANYNTLALSGSLHTDTYNATFQSIIETVLARIATLRGELRACPTSNTTNSPSNDSNTTTN